MVIRIDRLTKIYNKEKVLSDFSAVFETGGRYLIKGASGTGKTTLLRIIMGLEEPSGGTITVADNYEETGKEAGANKEYRKQIRNMKLGAVFQEDRLCEEESAAMNIRITNPEVGTEDIRKELAKLLDPEDIDKPAGKLSGGMKRRVSIVRACMAPRDIYLLDEPFTGLDAENARKCAAYIAEKTGDGILIITTHLEEYLDIIPKLNIISV